MTELLQKVSSIEEKINGPNLNIVNNKEDQAPLDKKTSSQNPTTSETSRIQNSRETSNPRADIIKELKRYFDKHKKNQEK